MKTFISLITVFLFSVCIVFSQTITETYSEPGTYTFSVPQNIVSITVECWGGGGAGGGSTTGGAGAGGGGGGAYSRSVVPVSPGMDYELIVGEGGIGSTGNGGSGTLSSFNSNQVMAVGGSGGIANQNGFGGFGGFAIDCIGDFRYSGGNGAAGSGSNTGGGGGGAGTNHNGENANGMTGGTGGADFGGNGADGFSSSGYDGDPGMDYGGGGSGGLKSTGWFASNMWGGNGADGAVKITYTIPECIGIPNAGTAIASLQSGCEGESINLVLSSTNYSSGFDGLSYQWQVSTDGTTWNDITGENNPDFLDYAVSTTNYFRLQVTCSYSSETVNSNAVTYTANVCDSYNIDEHINVTTCAAMFYDSGGPATNYDNDEDETITFCSDNGDNLRVEFLEFNVEDNGGYGRDQVRYDKLLVYDGPDDTYPQMFEFSGVQTATSRVPLVVSSQECLTFKFTSDGSDNRSGWKALVTCTDEVNSIASQFCGSSPMICNLNGYTGNTSNFYNPVSAGGIPTGSSTDEFPGLLDNNSIISFTASDTDVVLELNIANCFGGSGDDLVQFGVYSGDCDNFTLISEYDYIYYGIPEGAHEIIISGLNPGDEYLL